MADIVQDIVVGGMPVASVSICIREALPGPTTPTNPTGPTPPIVVPPVEPIEPVEPEIIPPPIQPNAPSIISNVTAPYMKAMTDDQTPIKGFVSGVYETSAPGGSIVTRTVQFKVNGTTRNGAWDLVAGDVVLANETVTDSTGEVAVFTTAPVTVTELTAPVTPPVVVNPPVTTAKTVTYFSASCSNKGQNAPVWDWVLPRVRNGELVDRVIFHGDTNYYNTTSIASLESVFQGKQGDVVRESRAMVTPSDHDWLGNDSQASTTSRITTLAPEPQTRDPAVRLWREYFDYLPWALPNDTDPLYYKRDDAVIPLRTLITDCRTRKVNYSVMWGTQQLDWIKAQFLDAKSKGLFVRLVIDVPPRGGEASKAELDKLGAYILSIGMENQFELLSGDQHCIGFDSGANNVFGGCKFPFVSGGTVRSSQSVKQSPHDGGTYWAPSGDNAYSQGIFSKMTWDGANGLRIEHTAFAGLAVKDPATGQNTMRILKVYERNLTRNYNGTTTPTVPGTPTTPTSPVPVTIEAFDSDLLVSQMGICMHLFQGEFWGLTTAWEQYLYELGIRNVRTAIGTSLDQKTQLLRILQTGNMKALIRTGLATGIPQSVAATEYLQNADFTGRLLGIEGMNEPNFGSPNYDDPNWVANTRNTQIAIKNEADSHPLTDTLPVVGPSLWKRDQSDINLLGNLAPYSEVNSIHYYTNGRQPIDGSLGDVGITPMQNVIAALSKTAPGAPAWVTECGYNVSGIGAPVGTPGTITPDLAAIYLLREIMLFFMYGVEKVFPYALVDSETTGNRYGLVELIGAGATATFRPRPAFYALQRMIQRFANTGPVLIPSGVEFSIPNKPSTIQTVQLQKKDRSRIIAIWNEVEVGAANPPKAITLNFPVDRTVTVFEPNVSGTGRLAGRGKSFALNVPTNMMLLEVI